MKKITFFLFILFILYACKKTSSPIHEDKISGSITYYDINGTIIDSTYFTEIKLFPTESIIDSLKDINKDYDVVFSDFIPELFTDFRKLGDPIYQTTTNNGNFEITKNSDRDYILVYESPNFGWHYRFLKATVKEINLKMRKKIEIDYGISHDNLVWGPDQFVTLSNDFYCYGNLTIEKNTVLTFSNPAKLYINSNLYINGNSDYPVILTSSSDNPHIGDWGQITIESSSETAEINFCIIRWSNLGIINRGNLTLENSILADANNGIQQYYSNLQISNSLLYSLNKAISIYDTDAQNIIPKIEKSIIMNNDVGIFLQGSSPQISNNILYKNNFHIDLLTTGGHVHYGTEPNIQNCVFDKSNDYAIRINRASPSIKKSVFRNNFIKPFILSKNAEFIINNNNFFSLNNQYVFYLSYRSGGSTIDATNNWWNTTSETVIQNLIYDENDEPGGDDIGYVNFEPYKTHEIQDAGPQ